MEDRAVIIVGNEEIGNMAKTVAEAKAIAAEVQVHINSTGGSIPSAPGDVEISPSGFRSTAIKKWLPFVAMASMSSSNTVYRSGPVPYSKKGVKRTAKTKNKARAQRKSRKRNLKRK